MKKLLLYLPFLILLAACSSTSNVTNSWSAPEANKKTFNKVIVVALMNPTDRGLKQRMEDQLANNLKATGVNVTTATAEFGPKSFEGLKETQVLRRLKASGIDGVVTIALLDKSKEENFVPGSVRYDPYPVYVRGGRFWGYYSTYYQRVYTPGYYETSSSYYFETNLYNAANSKLLYSAQSESIDPSSLENLADTQAKAIANDMKKNKAIM